MKPLKTEPSLIHPEYHDVKPVYCVSRLMPCSECGDDAEPHRMYDEDNALCEFDSYDSAVEFILEYFDVKIEKLEPINKRGKIHFE